MNLPAARARPCRIVVRGVNWLGDAVMTAPALMRLREKYSEAFIVLSTPEKLAPLWLGHPSINAVESWAPAEGPFTIARRLRERRFDSGVIFPNSFRSALELWSAGIPRRVGYGTQW